MADREYISELSLSLDQIRQMRSAQYQIYENAFANKTSATTLAEKLGSLSGILGLVFLTNTAVGVATGVFGILAGFVPSEEKKLEEYVYAGSYHMQALEDFLVNNSEYDRIKVKLPFIEYDTPPSGKIRFVMAEGLITGARYPDGRWEMSS